MGCLERLRGDAGAAQLRDRGAERRRPRHRPAARPGGGRGPRPAARPRRRPDAGRRRRPRPGLLRRRAARRDEGHLARARPLRAGADPAGAGARHAGAGDLPRHAAAQRRARRHPRSSTCPRRSAARCTARSPGPSASTRCGSSPDRSPTRAAGTEGLVVRSHHHQGVDRVGEGLRVSGWSVRRRPDRGDRAARQALRPRSCSGTRRRTWTAASIAALVDARAALTVRDAGRRPRRRSEP